MKKKKKTTIYSQNEERLHFLNKHQQDLLE